jgi:hypothetical protein
MATNPWADPIRAARTEDEVVTLVQRYLRAFSPAVLQLLPEACRVSEISTADNVAESTLSIMKSEWSVDPGSAAAPIVKDMSQTFLLAYERLRQLRGRQRPEAVQ